MLLVLALKELPMPSAVAAPALRGSFCGLGSETTRKHFQKSMR